ncbi:hypothetical protein B9Z19DRAFT_413502 [Tuber borchii]|uniref:Uncharacterized protein n=1 Tax=Tuber borchii TaxID=42251 RepID=A0A2T6ZGU1_TUBBO|nr:hypothetical protein B9Z19DRAFT_413502 [Tuber borchii]
MWPLTISEGKIHAAWVGPLAGWPLVNRTGGGGGQGSGGMFYVQYNDNNMADRFPFSSGFAGQRGRRSGLHCFPDCCFCLLLLLACLLVACLPRSFVRSFIILPVSINSFPLLILYSALACLAVTPLPLFSLSRLLSHSLFPTTTTTTIPPSPRCSFAVSVYSQSLSPSFPVNHPHLRPYGARSYPAPAPHTRRASFLCLFPFGSPPSKQAKRA